MTDIPPYIEEAILDAERHNFGRDSELGAAPGKRTNKPAPGLSPPVTPKTTVARGELPAPHVWA
jgi:hypothetical protein